MKARTVNCTPGWKSLNKSWLCTKIRVLDWPGVPKCTWDHSRLSEGSMQAYPMWTWVRWWIGDKNMPSSSVHYSSLGICLFPCGAEMMKLWVAGTISPLFPKSAISFAVELYATPTSFCSRANILTSWSDYSEITESMSVKTKNCETHFLWRRNRQ